MGLIMFLDESGDHSLTKIDPQYPQFVLCGVIMDEQHHDKVATEALARFKRELFDNEKIILHTVDFTRNRNDFEEMANPEFRKRFFGALEDLIEKLEFKFVACVIKKDVHIQKYGLRAVDPYMLSLDVLIERFIFETGSLGGAVIAESRGGTLDNALELAFLDLKIRGTDFVPASKIRKRIHSFSIREKRDNLAGLQLADVLATPTGRHIQGKRTYEKYSRHGDFFNCVEPKFRKDWKGKYEGMGLVVLPK